MESTLLKDDANNSLSVQDRQILVFILGVDVVMRYIGASAGLPVDVPRQVLHELKRGLRQVSCLPRPSLQELIRQVPPKNGKRKRRTAYTLTLRKSLMSSL